MDFNKIKCLFGSHDWEYADANTIRGYTGSFRLAARCKRCGKELEGHGSFVDEFVAEPPPMPPVKPPRKELPTNTPHQGWARVPYAREDEFPATEYMLRVHGNTVYVWCLIKDGEYWPSKFEDLPVIPDGG